MLQSPVRQTTARPRSGTGHALRPWALSTAALSSAVLVACVWVALAAVARPAAAAEPAATPGTSRSAIDTARMYVVMQGDTLDRIVNKTMASSPLKPELLREALVAANPQAITAGRNPRLKPGTVLQLPDHEALLRRTVQPLLPPPEQAVNAEADARKRWVRYP